MFEGPSNDGRIEYQDRTYDDMDHICALQLYDSSDSNPYAAHKRLSIMLFLFFFCACSNTSLFTLSLVWNKSLSAIRSTLPPLNMTPTFLILFSRTNLLNFGLKRTAGATPQLGSMMIFIRSYTQ